MQRFFRAARRAAPPPVASPDLEDAKPPPPPRPRRRRLRAYLLAPAALATLAVIVGADLVLANPSLVLATTRRGGHLAFYEGLMAKPWAERVALEWLGAALEVVPASVPLT